jgi:hypothetical protein
MPTRALVAAVLLAATARGYAAGAPSWCGSAPGPSFDALWAHRERVDRPGGPRALATPRESSFAVGQIAVLVDEGDLALPRNQLDLVNLDLGFVPVEGGYRVALGAQPLLTDPGTPVPLGDDDSREVALPFAFSFYGRRYDRVFVNSDGNLTFGEPDSASTPRRIGRLVNGPPRIAPLLTDLDPSAGGAVATQALGDRFVVSWREVPNFESPLKNTFQAILYADGRLDFVYGTLNGNFEEGVTGIAPGRGEGGLTAVDFKNASGESGGGALAESFRSENAIDTVAVARKYFRSFPDAVDQLVVFTYRRLTGPGTFAYELGIKNEVSGLGEGLYDDSAEFGSAGRLESFVMMDALGKYPEDPAQIFLSGVDSALSILAHETGHRWLAHARFLDGGERSDALLGRQLAHWSFFMNSSASFLEGNEIQDLGGGQFKTVGASLRYGPLDQYLMGLRAASEVPTFFFVANVPSQYGDRQRQPEPGLTFPGTRRDVALSEVIAAIGRRSPEAPAAPTVLRQAFVFVAGGSPSDADLAKLERLRAAFPAFYSAGTEGRGEVDPRID